MNIPALSQISADFSENISKKEFNDQYGFPAKPVVFRNAFQKLPIKNKWTLAYLADHLHDPVVLESLIPDNDTIKLSLQDYLRTRLENYYYKTSEHLQTALKDDYHTPDIFDCWYASTTVATPRQRLSWLYVGLKGTYSELHRDVWSTSAWNYLISGRKIWLIYPSAFSEHIANHKDEFSIQHLLQNDFEKAFRFRYRPLVCEQLPGDLIFVPGAYFHCVVNEEDSVSLTENFINETNYDDVRNYFKKRDNVKNKKFIEAIVKEGFGKVTI
jgi:hypothetical protein